MGQNANGFDLLSSFLPALIIGGIGYVYMAVCLMIIARKTHTPNGWMAWIPLLNLFLMCQCGRCSPAWAIGMIIPCLNIIAVPVVFGAIARVRGHSPWLGLLVFVPVINLFLPAILAAGEPSPGGAPAGAGTAGAPAGPPPGPRPCPKCGAAAAPDAAFCGECGQAIPAAPAAPPTSTPAGAAAPAAAGSGCGMIALVGVVLVGALMLGLCGVGAYFLLYEGSYDKPVQQQPDLPPRLAGTMEELPMDDQMIPTQLASQSFPEVPGVDPGGQPGEPGGAGQQPQVNIPAERLPPGLPPERLPQITINITVVTYRQPDAPGQPGVNVAVLDTSRNRSAGRDLTRDIVQATGGTPRNMRYTSPGTGQRYDVTRIESPEVVVYVMVSAPQDRVVMVYAPLAQAAGADRLANRVGNGGGVADPQFVPWMWVLPARPPGVWLVDLQVITRQEVLLAGQDARSQVQSDEEAATINQLLALVDVLMPERLIIARYINAAGLEWNVAVCDYDSLRKARQIWWTALWTVGTAAESRPQVQGVSGLQFTITDGAGQAEQLVAFRKGPYVTIVGKTGRDSLQSILALANALQM